MGFVRCVRFLLLPIARRTFDASDTAEDRFRKQLMVGVGSAMIIVALLLSITSIFNNISIVHYLTGGPVVLVGFVASMLHMMCTRRLSKSHVGVMVVFIAVNAFIMDWRTYGRLDVWAMAVLAMDLLLLCSCNAQYVTAVRVSTLVYLAYDGVEQATHLTYDMLPQTSVFKKDETTGVYEVLWIYCVRCTVFLLDFTMTRFFSEQMHKEQSKMKASIELTQQVTASLVAFDLAEAGEVLEKSPPSEQKEVLEQLLRNLHSYRPYLPDALFSEKPSLDLDHYRLPPEGKVALVFTDVQSSTATWEVCPKGMRKAMETHNRIIRECIATYNGYEVKTIGDAFMVAFDSSAEACLFGLEVQGALYESDEWSAELLAVPQCSLRQGMWNGLRVRIGVHVGDAVMEINPVTGRGDYFGPNVNTAARVEGAAWSGTVAVTQDVLDSLAGGAAVVGSPAVLPLGEKTLKGIASPVPIHLLAPSALRGRLEDTRIEAPPPLPIPAVDITSVESSTLGASFNQQQALLRHTTASVACVRVDYTCLSVPLGRDVRSLQFSINEILSTVIDTSGRMGGQVSSVSNSTVLVTWNAAQPCPSHAIQSVLFSGALSRSRIAHLSDHITVGIATGSLLHGSVGSASQMFVGDIGQCIDLAGGLAAGAAFLGAFVLLAAAPGHICMASDLQYKAATRKVDEWELENGVVEVMEVNTGRLGKWGMDEEQWGWSAAYRTAFNTREVRLLRTHAVEDCDKVMGVVADMLAAGTHLERPLPVSLRM